MTSTAIPSPPPDLDAVLGGGCGLDFTCATGLEPVVGAAKDAVVGAAEDALDKVWISLRVQVQGMVEWVIENTFTWWIDTPGLDVGKQRTVIEQIRGYMLPLAVAVLVGGLMVQGIRMSLLRRADPMVQAGRGLLTFGLVSGAGTTAVITAMEAGDSFSTWVLNKSTQGHFIPRVTEVLTLDELTFNPGVVIILGFFGFAASLVQAILLVLREPAAVVLAGTMTLAAAGKVTKATEGWFPRVTGWCLAVIAYKPVCALVYATAFAFIKNAENTQAVFVGFAMMILSIFAMAPLTRLFSWTVGEVGSGGGGAGQLLMNAGFALQALGGMRRGGGGGGGDGAGGGWSAARHAAHMEKNGPAGAGGGGHGSPSSPRLPPPPRPPRAAGGNGAGPSAAPTGGGGQAGSPAAGAAAGAGAAGAAVGAAAQAVGAVHAQVQKVAGTMAPPDGASGTGAGSPPAEGRQ